MRKEKRITINISKKHKNSRIENVKGLIEELLITDNRLLEVKSYESLRSDFTFTEIFKDKNILQILEELSSCDILNDKTYKVTINTTKKAYETFCNIYNKNNISDTIDKMLYLYNDIMLSISYSNLEIKPVKHIDFIDEDIYKHILLIDTIKLYKICRYFHFIIEENKHAKYILVLLLFYAQAKDFNTYKLEKELQSINEIKVLLSFFEKVFFLKNKMIKNLKLKNKYAERIIKKENKLLTIKYKKKGNNGITSNEINIKRYIIYEINSKFTNKKLDFYEKFYCFEQKMKFLIRKV